jgi:hypothetical protein
MKLARALIDGLGSHRFYLNRAASTCERVLTARLRRRFVISARARMRDNLFSGVPIEGAQGRRNSPEIPRDNLSSSNGDNAEDVSRYLLDLRSVSRLSYVPARLI